MSMTSRQDIPSRPGEHTEGWTKRTLISVSSAMNVIAKTFNALEAILLFQVFVAGVGELAGRRLSIGWYVILGLTLAVNAYLRFISREVTNEKA